MSIIGELNREGIGGEIKLADLVLQPDNRESILDFNLDQILMLEKDRVRDHLRQLLDRKDFYSAAYMAAAIKIAVPSMKESDWNITETDLAGLVQEYKDCCRDAPQDESGTDDSIHDWHFAILQAMRIKIFRGEKDLDLERDWPDMKSRLDESRFCQGKDFIEEMEALKILFPEKKYIRKAALTSVEIRMIVDYYDEFISNGRFEEATRWAARMKILAPNKFALLECKKDWSEFEISVRDKISSEVSIALNIAANMRIMAAKQIEITDLGLHLIMPQIDFVKKIIPRPQRLRM